MSGNRDQLMKICNVCNTLLSFKEFYKNNHMADGYLNTCKCCSKKQVNTAKRNKASKEYKARNIEKVREASRLYRLENKDKEIHRNKNYKEQNKEKIALQRKEYREANKASIKEYRDRYREENKEECNARTKEWHRLNKHISNSYTAKRRFTKRQACPSWVCQESIKEVYLKARELTETTGIQYHVDHIIPLINNKVSGLHVLANLRIIPYYENLSKSNKLIEDIV